MKIAAIILTLFFQSAFFYSYSQRLADTSLAWHIEQIQHEKFDSIGWNQPLPRMLKRYFRKQCGTLTIRGSKQVIRKGYHNRKELVYKSVGVILKSNSYYLFDCVTYTDPYSIAYLMICRCEGKKVAIAFSLKELFVAHSAKDLIIQLKDGKFSRASLCE